MDLCLDLNFTVFQKTNIYNMKWNTFIAVYHAILQAISNCLGYKLHKNLENSVYYYKITQDTEFFHVYFFQSS